ncbi:SAM-dependent methyltransferase [Pusillimonas sp. T2]|uniref:class I SAM-dependent methyltransferase n=1 Tax=Pusillimonas sp. T2 TaxID=1548123 RepID=UPI000B9C82F0|nr:class I SAM-dependent methyltransferase [Pusillimonas sp. T2]OXR47987.1 SAM-dependent methyltransferase [Pusillimonas sp. T2]
MKCRHCGTVLQHTFLDLGFAPPSNAYLTQADLSRPEKYYPLKVRVCDQCWLVQTEDYAQAHELFSSDYAYFSSTSSSWLAHAKHYAEMIAARLALDGTSQVIELASNDGYLLKNFVAAGIPCLGIEPTASTAAAAEALGIPVLREFFSYSFGQMLAESGRQADLIIGNNVYAHVPDINDFTLGMAIALKPCGTITLEFPHLLRLIENNQFDTIYHEHFSYLSLHVAQTIFKEAGLRIYDVEELPTHGGSIRIYGCHARSNQEEQPAVARLLEMEIDQGLLDIRTYQAFQAEADRIKNDLHAFLIEQKRLGNRVAAYGAAAKGNTLLNYAGIKPDLLPFVCDAARAKQGMYMPGSHIPILPPDALLKGKLDYLLILPWNLAAEVQAEQDELLGSGVVPVVAVPYLNRLR